MTTLKVGNIEHPDGGSNAVSVGGTGGINLPVGTGAQRPGAATAGTVRFNTETGEPEFFNATNSQWYRTSVGAPIQVDYLVIAGGGGGGNTSSNIAGGGGGAGGYRTSFGTGNVSGGLSAVEAAFAAKTGSSYTITVGAGGANDVNGSDSVFGTITSTGGGAGAYWGSAGGSNGGSGGGGTGVTTGGNTNGGSGTTGQGFGGGQGRHENGAWVLGGGGGGAGAAGANFVSGGAIAGGAGGAGIASSITGTSVTRAGGGGGGSHANGSGGAGGAGGGGTGATLSSTTATSGTANTGGGGGGNGNSVAAGAAGGSGVVILRISAGATATFSSGVTYSLSTAVSGFKIYTVTATTTTSETVTLS
jgi:hypothetical protein